MEAEKAAAERSCREFRSVFVEILLMSEVNEFVGFLDEGVGRAKSNGIRYSSAAVDAAAGDWKFQVAEFAKGAAEMSVEFGKGVRDVVNQTVLREDSVIMKKFKGPCLKVFGKLRFLNEYLPEDRDPVHAWTVIACVSIVVLAGNSVCVCEECVFLVLCVNYRTINVEIIVVSGNLHYALR